MNAPVTTAPQNDAPRRRTSKRVWLVLGALVLAPVLVFASVTIAGGIREARDVDELTAARDAFTLAAESEQLSWDEATAARERFDALVDAADTAAVGLTKTAKVVPAGLVKPAGVLKDVRATGNDIRDAVAAALKETADLEPIEPVQFDVDAASAKHLATAQSDARDRTLWNWNAVSAYDGAAKRVAAAISASEPVLGELVEAVAAKGERLTFAKAGKKQREALTRAKKKVVALVTDDEALRPVTVRKTLAGYVKAINAAQKSHAAHVARERRDASRSEQRTGDSGTGSSRGSSGTGSSGSGSNGSGSKGSGSTGSGSKGSGSKGSGSKGSGSKGSGSSGEGSSEPECWGNQENACAKTPPTFTTNSHFVPYGECRGRASLGSHNVGYGGTSLRGGESYDFPWSAYVDGPTVYYVACR